MSKKKKVEIPDVIKPGTRVLVGKPEYKAEFVFVCEDGFGLRGSALGQAIFGYFECDGEKARIARHQIKGLAPVVVIPRPVSIPAGEVTVNQSNSLDFIIIYEQGELEPDAQLALFSYLVRSGLAWKLQGVYGRQAVSLINGGWLDKQGNILKSLDEE